jgi:hypothetical protein
MKPVHRAWPANTRPGEIKSWLRQRQDLIAAVDEVIRRVFRLDPQDPANWVPHMLESAREFVRATDLAWVFKEPETSASCERKEISQEEAEERAKAAEIRRLEQEQRQKAKAALLVMAEHLVGSEYMARNAIRQAVERDDRGRLVLDHLDPRDEPAVRKAAEEALAAAARGKLVYAIGLRRNSAKAEALGNEAEAVSKAREAEKAEKAFEAYARASGRDFAQLRSQVLAEEAKTMAEQEKKAADLSQGAFDPAREAAKKKSGQKSGQKKGKKKK